MYTSWMLNTHGNPLAAVRQLLRGLWIQADLEGMLIPVYQADGTVAPRLVQDSAALTYADPFAPLATMNAAQAVAQLTHTWPKAQMAAVLRPCEVRALTELSRRNLIDLDHWLIIGVDCLATFDADDYQWRLDRAGGAEELTDSVLRFARQGGIAPYRLRRACQMCTAPAAVGADLNICLLGMPAQKVLLLTSNDAALADKIDLAPLVEDRVSPALLEQHRRVVAGLVERRRRQQQRATAALPVTVPANVDELVNQLFACAAADPPCRACLEACPLCGEFGLLRNGTVFDRQQMAAWLTACVQCGMCEASCPQHRPLTAIVGRITRSLQAETAAA